MMYRILKVPYRKEYTAEIQFTYYLQEYKGSWLFPNNKKWRNVTRQVCYGMDCYKENVYFNDRDDAEKYLENLMDEIPGNTVVSVAKT